MPFFKRKSYGKKREPLREIKKSISHKSEYLSYNGPKNRFLKIFEDRLALDPFFFMQKLQKEKGISKPEVMFLDAGRGEHIVEFNSLATDIGLKPKVDVFSLTKSLSENVSRFVRKDFSNGISFEELNIKNSKFKFLENKYNLVINSIGEGYHTRYPVNALFTSALMLKEGGCAYIEFIKPESVHFITKPLLKIEQIKRDPTTYKGSKSYYIKQLKNLKTLFEKMVNLYNPKLKYKFEVFKSDNIKENKQSTFFVKVERLR